MKEIDGKWIQLLFLMLFQRSWPKVLELGMIGVSCILHLRVMIESIMWTSSSEFDFIFEEFGGFDGMYLKMLASGVPTAVQLMWIPLSELDIRQQFLVVTRILSQCLIGLWNSGVVSYVRAWVSTKIKNITDDLMVVVGFPLVELIIPKQVRMSLGMAWPEEAYQFVGTTWYLKWQSEAEMNYKARKTTSIQWYLWFLIRSAIYGNFQKGERIGENL